MRARATMHVLGDRGFGGQEGRRKKMETRRDRLNLERKCKWKKFAEKEINVIMLF